MPAAPFSGPEDADGRPRHIPEEFQQPVDQFGDVDVEEVLREITGPCITVETEPTTGLFADVDVEEVLREIEESSSALMNIPTGDATGYTLDGTALGPPAMLPQGSDIGLRHITTTYLRDAAVASRGASLRNTLPHRRSLMPIYHIAGIQHQQEPRTEVPVREARAPHPTPRSLVHKGVESADHPTGRPLPQTRFRTPPASEEEWYTMKPLIQVLYYGRNIPLKEVRAIMKSHHGFEAT